MTSSKTFSFKKNSRKAFTLIELSIVLIIIGLLIVAITSGSSLIRNAKLRSITNEAKQYQVAVNSFFMKFDEYPGDFNQAIGTGDLAAVAGNNNDLIEWENAQAATAGEGSNAWLHLMQADILPSDAITSLDTAAEVAEMLDATSATNDLNPGTHFPSSAENAAGWVFGNNGTINYVYITGSLTDAFAGAGPVVAAPTLSAVLNTADAYSIDNKSDDGSRTTGDIIETLGGDCADNGTVSQYDLTTDSSTKPCALGFKVTIN